MRQGAAAAYSRRTSRMTEAPTSFGRLLDVHRIALDPGIGAFVASAAVTAADYLGGHAWGAGFRGMWFGGGVAGLAGAFLVRLARPVGAEHDELLWVVAGHVPTAYMVTDRVPSAREALAVYCGLIGDWVAACCAGGSRSEVFPVRWSDDAPSLAVLEQQLAAIRHCAVAAADPRWIDVGTCPSRPDPGASAVPTGSPGSAALTPGMLVRDHRGEVGVLLSRAAPPDAKWLQLQRDPRVRAHVGAWWKVAPVSGGSVSVPDHLLDVVTGPREPWVAQALANANEFGRQTIRAALGAWSGG